MEILPLTSVHCLPDGRVHLLGAVECVTGSATRVEIGSYALLVDCGVVQGRGAADWTLPDGATDAAALLLTHGHLDHVGGIPAALDAGFGGPIFGTRTTLAIADIVISDSIRLAGGSEDDERRFRRRFSQLSRAVPYETPVHHSGFDGSFAFREAGHILGSASVEITTAQSRVICSGDLGRPDSPILRDYCETWARTQPVDLVILESTYGARDHAHGHDDIEKELERIVRRTVHLGGQVLIPAFAVGRTQTLLYYLCKLIESGRIPSLPVAVDTPMGLRVTDLYEHARDLYDAESLERLSHGHDPLDFASLYGVRRASDSFRLRDICEPMIIIAGSGMCTGGRVVAHLKELLPRESTTLLFAGYQAPGTPGAAVQAAGRRHGRVWLDGEEVPVRARVETLTGLSAHADRRELLRWLRAVPGVRRVGLHHGEPEAQRAFAAFAQAAVSTTADRGTCSA